MWIRTEDGVLVNMSKCVRVSAEKRVATNDGSWWIEADLEGDVITSLANGLTERGAQGFMRWLSRKLVQNGMDIYERRWQEAAAAAAAQAEESSEPAAPNNSAQQRRHAHQLFNKFTPDVREEWKRYLFETYGADSINAIDASHIGAVLEELEQSWAEAGGNPCDLKQEADKTANPQ